MSANLACRSLLDSRFDPLHGLQVRFSDATLNLPLLTLDRPTGPPATIPKGVSLGWGDRGLELGYRSAKVPVRIIPSPPPAQGRFEFDRSIADQTTRHALWAWSQATSKEIVALFERAGAQFRALYGLVRRVARDAIDLGCQLPQLCRWLADLQLRSPKPLWPPGQMPRLTTLLSMVSLPGRKWLIKALRKLPLLDDAQRTRRLVRSLVMDPVRIKAWRCCGPLSQAAAELLLAPPFELRVTAGLLDEVSAVGDAAGGLLIESLRALSASRRLGALEERREWTLALLLEALGPHLSRRTLGSLGVQCLPVPAWKGRHGLIEPILSVPALEREGEAMQHCVGLFRQSALRGERAFYRVLSPERGTLALRWRDGELWHAELKGRRNAPLSSRARARVRRCLGLREPPLADCSLLAPLTQLEPLDSLTIEIGKGAGPLADFRLSDADVHTLCRRHSNEVKLFDDDSSLSAATRVWAQLTTAEFRTLSDLMAGELNGVGPLADTAGVVTTRPGGPVQVEAAVVGAALRTTPGRIDDATWLRAVQLHDPAKITRVAYTGCPGLTGAALASLPLRTLLELRLGYCPDLDVHALLAGALEKVRCLTLAGCRLRDPEIASLILRWRPRSVDLSYVYGIGPATVSALEQVGARAVVGGLSPGAALRLATGPLALSDPWFTLVGSVLSPSVLAALAGAREMLSVHDCLVPGGDWSGLSGGRLTHLYLGGCGRVSERLLAEVATLRRLKDLSLVGDGVLGACCEVRAYRKHGHLADHRVQRPPLARLGS